MPSVQVLPDDLVNQIAAGEVIERPASVVKELVENALDAEATRIDVAIAQGGVRSIAVGDDGVGMAPEDARLAFARHATSKLARAADLERVATLGFRGEALPSIASVARVRLRTRRPEDPIGVELRGEGRGISHSLEVACSPGTRVEVGELFLQVPARRKFLKSAATEAGHVVRWLERVALARPDVRIALARDGRDSLLFLPTADARERAVAVLPPSVGERLVAVDAAEPTARVTGFATPTDVMRGTTADIHVFVNGRPVRDRLLLHWVREAYRDALPSGRHPATVLYLQVDPGGVDVNVHPAKWEVRFRDPGAIRRLILGGLRGAMGAQRRLYAHAAPPTSTPGELPLDAAPVLAGPAELAGASLASDRPFDAARPPVAFRSLRYLGQALGAYLVLEGPNGLILLDQHAAHERVLFERMRSSLLEGKLERQVLLAPVWIELERSAAEALATELELLERGGFDLEVGGSAPGGGVRVALRAVPSALALGRGCDWQVLLEETAAGLRDPAARERIDGVEGALHAVLASAACHAACRKGDRLDARAVEGLLEGLDTSVWVPNCPHGRPIWLHLDLAWLERRFLRRN